MEPFSARLRRGAHRIWGAIADHPFLRELHAGTLPQERFAYFVLQDYLYLLDFAQVLCRAAGKSPDLETLELLARHALNAVEVERSFHASFGRQLGLSRERLDRGVKGPATQAYVGYLQAVAGRGSLGEIVAAVLPCYWIYGETGRRLYRTRPRRPAVYRRWIELYASEDFWASVREQIRLADRFGAAASTAEKRLMRDHFMASSRYEYLFWDQAYGLEKWRV